MTERTFHVTLVLVAMLWLFADPASAMLHPQQGRFMQRDPLGYVDGMGAYEYVRSGPIGRLDMDGRQSTQYSPRMGYYVKFQRDGDYSSQIQIHFHPSGEQAKCCERIKFRQKFMDIRRNLLGGVTIVNWQDDKTDGDGYYIYQSAWVKGRASSANMWDHPGAPPNWAGWTTYTHLLQVFRTEAECTAGIDKGRKYGVIEWSHAFDWLKSARSVRRELQGEYKSGPVTDDSVSWYLESFPASP